MNLYFLVEYREDGRKSNFGEKGRFYMIEVENLSYAYRSEDEDGHEILAKPVIDSLNLQIKTTSLTKDFFQNTNQFRFFFLRNHRIR